MLTVWVALKQLGEHNSVQHSTGSCDWERIWAQAGFFFSFAVYCWTHKEPTDLKSQSFTPAQTKTSGEVSFVSMDTEQCPPFWINFELTLERWLSLVCLFRLKRKKNSIWKAKVALALMITSLSHNMKGTNQSLGTDRHTSSFLHTYTHTKPLPWTDYILQEDLIKEFLMRLLLALPRTVLIFALHNA